MSIFHMLVTAVMCHTLLEYDAVEHRALKCWPCMRRWRRGVKKKRKKGGTRTITQGANHRGWTARGEGDVHAHVGSRV